MSDIYYVETDAQKIFKEILLAYQEETEEVLYPGDEKWMFLTHIVGILVNIKNDINDTGRQNLLRYARDEYLDAMGELYGVDRLAAEAASCIVEFIKSDGVTDAVTIPAGTRITPDGYLYFATIEELVIAEDVSTGTVETQSTGVGDEYNYFSIGLINIIVDPVPYIKSAANTTASSSGADIEDDEDYRQRIRLSPESYSVAGPEGAYKYWAMTADNNISDVSVSSATPGEVDVYVLMDDGQIPNAGILQAVDDALNDDTRRPLTDLVNVAAPTVQSYDITLTYYISTDRQTEETAIKAAIEDTDGAVDASKAWQRESLGRDINPSQLIYNLMEAGASRVVLTSPSYTALSNDKVAQAGTVTITYGGIE